MEEKEYPEAEVKIEMTFTALYREYILFEECVTM